MATTDELEQGIAGYDVYFQRRDTGFISILVNLYIRLFQNSPTMLRKLSR